MPCCCVAVGRGTWDVIIWETGGPLKGLVRCSGLLWRKADLPRPCNSLRMYYCVAISFTDYYHSYYRHRDRGLSADTDTDTWSLVHQGT